MSSRDWPFYFTQTHGISTIVASRRESGLHEANELSAHVFVEGEPRGTLQIPDGGWHGFTRSLVEEWQSSVTSGALVILGSPAQFAILEEDRSIAAGDGGISPPLPPDDDDPQDDYSGSQRTRAADLKYRGDEPVRVYLTCDRQNHRTLLAQVDKLVSEPPTRL